MQEDRREKVDCDFPDSLNLNSCTAVTDWYRRTNESSLKSIKRYESFQLIDLNMNQLSFSEKKPTSQSGQGKHSTALSGQILYIYCVSMRLREGNFFSLGRLSAYLQGRGGGPCMRALSSNSAPWSNMSTWISLHRYLALKTMSSLSNESTLWKFYWSLEITHLRICASKPTLTHRGYGLC